MDSAEHRRGTYREPSQSAWEIPAAAPLVRAEEHVPVKVPARRRRLIAIAAAVTLVAGLLAKTLWPVMGSLGSTVVGPWDMTMSSGGSRLVVALVYGREAGLHLVRVHPSPDGSSSTRLFAKLGTGPLYVVSLGRSPLEVNATAPAQHQPMTWSARGRVIKAFKDDRGTGVRTW